MTFAVTMMTFDRSPRENFVAQTVENLARSGVFSSPLLQEFHAVDSGSPSTDFAYEAFVDIVPTPWFHTGLRQSPTQNAAYALRLLANSSADWGLFLEDDIDVCHDLLGSTAEWLQEHDRGHKVFPLGANYCFIEERVRNGKTDWPYPVSMFYGTLAVAMRPEIAGSLADFLDKRADRHTYDLHMAEWAKEIGEREFLTPAPSFIQHIGKESSIRPGSEFHEYATWPGRKWRYRSSR